MSVLVEQFFATNDYSEANISSIRSKVMEALSNTQRVNLYDANTSLRPSEDEYMVLRGYLQKPTFNSESKVIDGQVINNTEANLDFVVWVSDSKSGKAKVAYMFRTGFSGFDGKQDALNSACKYCQISMSKFVEDAAPLNGKIVSLDEVDDNKAKSVYINLGANDGIKSGLKFDVLAIQDIAGEPTPKIVGTITAKEVSENRTLCNVSDGEKTIAQYFNQSIPMSIRSRAKKGLFKSIGKVMEGFGSNSVLSTKTGMPLSSEGLAQLDNDFGTIVVSSSKDNNPNGNAESKIAASPSTGYLDFATFKSGKRVIEPYHNWSGTMEDIRSYMKNAGYKEESGNMGLMYKVVEGNKLCIYTHSVINGKIFSSTVVISGVNREAAINWMKSHYELVESQTSGFSDYHTFKSADDQTIININFASLNGAAPNATIVYQNNTLFK